MNDPTLHLGARELAAILLAVVIIVDWAAQRYGQPTARDGEGPLAHDPAPHRLDSR